MRVFVVGSIMEETQAEFTQFCLSLGHAFASNKIEVMLCSPYPDSADCLIVSGFKNVRQKELGIEVYYPRLPKIENDWNQVITNAGVKNRVRSFPQEPPISSDRESLKYAWLFSQIQAMSNANYVIVLGGRLSGSSNFLVRIAEVQNKLIIPLPRFGGVGLQVFNRMQYQLTDYWGTLGVEIISSSERPDQLLQMLCSGRNTNKGGRLRMSQGLTFFISYSREKNADADFVEMVLRRRNQLVVRDENDIGSSEDIPNAIRENIAKSDVFVALWCKEYACSPWCFDELDIALKTHVENSHKKLWLIRTDKTRIIHPDARKRVYYDVASRQELDGRIVALLDQL